MIGLITISLIAVALYGKSKESGMIGRIPTKARRNKYAEIEYLQGMGVDFSKESPDHSSIPYIKNAIKRFGYKPSRNANYVSIEEYYFKDLQKLYKRVTRPVGIVQEADVSRIYNKNGDLAMVHYQYDVARDLERALGWYYDSFFHQDGSTDNGFALGTYAIANGTKFIWDDPDNYGLKQELGYGPEERKRYSSILGKKKNNAVTVKKLAEGNSGYYGDDMELRDGIIDAVRDFNTKDMAREYILNLYYDSIKTPDEEDYAPF